MAVTKQDIANYLGVSRTAVSLALNQSPKCTLSEKSRRKIFEAAKELGYPLEQSAGPGSTKKICVATFNMEEKAAKLTGQASLNAIDDYLAGKGYNVVYLNVGRSERSLKRFYEYVESGEAAGVILLCLLDPAVLEHLNGCNVPYIVFSEMEEAYPNCCTIDGEYAAEQITERLISLGHRRIAFFACDLDYPQQRHLLAGYRAVLEREGLPYDPALVQVSREEDGRELASRMDFLGVQYTAALCSNSVIELGALGWLNAHGVRVPEDVSLLGYGYNDLVTLSRPVLSVFDSDEYILCGLPQLMESIESGKKDYPCQKIRTGHFFAGETIASARTGK